MVPAGGELSDSRIEEYWDWLGGVLFLLLTVDTLTTVMLASDVGPEHEANPLVRWFLSEGLWTLVVANILALVVIVTFFWAIIQLLQRTPTPFDHYFALLIDLWIGALLAAGLALFANNLAALVWGRSLF